MNNGIPIVEDHEAFANHVRTHTAGIVWLAYTLTEVCAILKLANEFRNDLANIRLMPDTRTLELFKGGTTKLLGEPTIKLLQFFNVLVEDMPVVCHGRTHWSMTTRIRGSSRDVSIAAGSSQEIPSGPRSMASAAKQTASRKWRDASHTIFCNLGIGRSNLIFKSFSRRS